MNNLPKLPVRYVTGNSDLLKSQEALSGGKEGATDYKYEETAPSLPGQVVSSFNAPVDRNIGNVLFRRLPDGLLDLDNAKNVVVDVIHKVKDGLPLTNLEKTAIGVIFPEVWDTVPANLREPLMQVHLRLSDVECTLIAHKVAAHLAAEMNYAAQGINQPGAEQVRT